MYLNFVALNRVLLLKASRLRKGLKFILLGCRRLHMPGGHAGDGEAVRARQSVQGRGVHEGPHRQDGQEQRRHDRL